MSLEIHLQVAGNVRYFIFSRNVKSWARFYDILRQKKKDRRTALLLLKWHTRSIPPSCKSHSPLNKTKKELCTKTSLTPSLFNFHIPINIIFNKFNIHPLTLLLVNNTKRILHFIAPDGSGKCSDCFTPANVLA